MNYNDLVSTLFPGEKNKRKGMIAMNGRKRASKKISKNEQTRYMHCVWKKVLSELSSSNFDVYGSFVRGLQLI